MHGDQLPSFGVDEHPVIRLGAVEIEYHRVDVGAGRQIVGERGGGERGPAAVEQRGQGAGARQVVRIVDLQHAGRVGAHQLGAPEEPVPFLAETVGAHRVGGAGLQQVLRPVLAARPERLVVVDPVAAGLAGLAPDVAVERGHGQRGVGAVEDRRGHAVQLLACEERAGALDEEHDIDRDAVPFLVHTHGVQDGGLAGRGVVGDLVGALDHFRARGVRRGGDARVVGGDDDRGQQARRTALADGAGDEGRVTDRREILARHPLGAPPGRDHSQHSAHGHAFISWSVAFWVDCPPGRGGSAARAEVAVVTAAPSGG